MRIVLLGPPGAGKGTQAKLICRRFEMVHLSTGDIFRRNIQQKTQLGIEAVEYIHSGALVPDKLTLELIKDRLSQSDLEMGYLLDGFPRTENQAEEFDYLLEEKHEKLDCVLLIEVPTDFIIERNTGRLICPNCDLSYHVKFNPPKIECICDKCGGALVKRKDDLELTVKERLSVYENQTKRLIKYYNDKGILSVIDGHKEIDEVFSDIKEVLNRFVK